jgi:ATP-dependent helicase/nuclease subunit A
MIHPVVEQLALSNEQRPAVIARGGDVAVIAGAGSGKTRTLVARYLALLAEGLPLRAIVAITFTRKAAREMRNRVREEIRRYLERSDLGEEEQQRWRDRYAELDAARIGTIHSLCADILRRHPAEAGIDPLFDVLEEGQVNILRERAAQETLAWAADQEDMAPLFARLGEAMLQGSLRSLLGQRLEAETAFTRLEEGGAALWEASVISHLQPFVDDRRVRMLFASLDLVRADGTLARAEMAGDRLAPSLKELLRLWDEIKTARATGDWAAVSVRLAPLRAQMKQTGRKNNWTPHEPKAAIRELQALYDETVASIVGQKGIDLALDRLLAEEMMPRLHTLFRFAVERYDRLKRDRQALDFDDLEAGALQLLRDQPAVRARWQGEIRGILVDEFQDTNARQRDLVRLLNGAGGKLFIVGDAKQSIYRFRGADVTVFRQEREAIAQSGGQVVTLATSYRPHRALLAGLNALLRPVLGEEEDPDRPWRATFTPLRPYREHPVPGIRAPHIELHLTAGSKRQGALARAADGLAGRLVELVEGGSITVGEGADGWPLDYGDIAILCRASTSFSAYEDALERAGVPFVTVAGRGFYDRPEIRDLLNALAALADPTDDLALAGLLRSPALALSDMTLYRLVEWRRQAADTPFLWDILQQRGPELPEDEASRARRAVRLIADLHSHVGRSPVADVLKAFLDEADYRAVLLRAGERRAVRNVAKLLEDAHASGLVAVREFLEYVQALRDTGAREGEARTVSKGAVQIMTVHAAKGLEFPVVAIADLTYQPPNRADLLLDPELGVLLRLQDEDDRLPAAYRLGKQRADDQEAAEADRLFYVAATRAREMLLLSGCIGLKKDNTPSKLSGWLQRIAEGDVLGLKDRSVVYREEGDRAIRLDMEIGGTPVVCFIYEPQFMSRRATPAEEVQPATVAPSFPLLAAVAPGTSPVDPKTRVEERIPPQRVWRVVPAVARPRAPAWVVGKLVHQALAQWRFPAEDYAHWAEARAQSHGLTDARQVRDAIARSRRMLVRFRAHPLYAEMNAATPRLHEVPYSRLVAGRVESGIIDALYLHDGRWRVVEFKTDDVRDEVELDVLLAEKDYRPQTRRYVTAVEVLLGQMPCAYLCFLNVGGRVYVREVAEE